MNEHKYYYVYETENLINGKKYIGKHHSNIKPENDGYLGSGKLITSAIKKYGRDNFKRKILCMCDTEEEAFEMEAFYIEAVCAYGNPNYYNLIPGGKGTPSKYVSLVVQSINEVDVNTFYDIYDASDKLGISTQSIYTYCRLCKKLNRTYGGYKFRIEKKLRSSLSNCVLYYDKSYFDVKEKIEIENGIWTESDDEFLKSFKDILTIKEIAEKLNRTIFSVSGRINKLGLSKNIEYFSKYEDNFLISNYEIHGSNYCAKELNRSNESIRSRANHIGLHRGKNEYSNNEIKYIITNYNSSNAKEISKHLNRPLQSIYVKMSRLELTKDNSYSEYEIFFLIKNYSEYGAKKCAEILGRSEGGVYHKARALGLKYDKLKNKSCKHKYVYYENGKYRVRMRIDGKHKNFGTFSNEEDACQKAYKIAKEYGKTI